MMAGGGHAAIEVGGWIGLIEADLGGGKGVEVLTQISFKHWKLSPHSAPHVQTGFCAGAGLKRGGMTGTRGGTGGHSAFEMGRSLMQTPFRYWKPSPQSTAQVQASLVADGDGLRAGEIIPGAVA